MAIPSLPFPRRSHHSILRIMQRLPPGPRRRTKEVGARPATARILLLASVCACIGFAGACIVTARLTGWVWDRTYFGATSDVLMLTGLFGGSVGWAVGTLIGWLVSRRSVEPNVDESWMLRLCGAGAAVLAILSLLDSPAGADPGAVIALALLPAVPALIAVTLMTLALRGGPRQPVAVVGTIASIAIVVAAGMQFNSFLPLDGSFLEGWRLAQPDAASFAPNLLDPAPDQEGCSQPSVRGRTFPTRDGFGRGGPGSAGRLDWLDGHVPRWLPDGFGLVEWRTWRMSVGTWADGRCRSVRLVLFEGEPESPPVLDRVGDWGVVAGSSGLEPARGGPYVRYLAWSFEEHGAGAGEVLGLYLEVLGMDRADADRVAMGIPVHGPPRPSQDAG